MSDDGSSRPLSWSLLKHRERVSSYLFALGARQSEVEEVIQEVALAAATSGNSPDVPLAWLLTVARRRFIDLLRSSQLRRRREQPIDELSEAVAEALAETETELERGPEAEITALRACLARLAPRARELIELRYWHELESAEIARRMAWSEPAVRVALSKARRAIEECIRRALRSSGRTERGEEEHGHG